MQLSRDRAGVEGLPLTLMVVMVVLAITVPLIFGSFRAYDSGRVEAALVSEINDFIHMVQLVYTSGPGNSATVEFAALSGSMTSIDYVAFGGEPDEGLESTVRYKLQGRGEQTVPVSSPGVPMMSEGSGAFVIASGRYRIVAECIASHENMTYALVRLGHGQ